MAPPPIWNNFDSIVRLDQEIHPLLPAQLARSNTQKKYSCSGLHRNSILMDSGASVMLMFNGNLLDAISTLCNQKGVLTDGGNFHTNQTNLLASALHHLPLPKDSYLFNPDVVGNLIFMAVVSDHHRIVMDTDINNAIYVFNDDGTYIRFQRTKRNLYCLHIGDTAEHKHCYLSTVEGTKMQYSALDQKRATAVQSLQERMGFPSDINLANAID